MKIKRFFAVMIMPALLAPSLIAQSIKSKEPADKTAQEETKKKALALADQIIKETEGLRLAENRIRIRASVADLLWQDKEKRARELMKQAMDEFLSIMASDTVSESESIYTAAGLSFPALARMQDYGLGQLREALRQQIIDILAKRDAKLARSFLRATSKPKGQAGEFGSPDYEGHIDINLAAKLSETDPEQALEIAEESLDRGLNPNLLRVLAGLQKKDKAAASKLLDLIVKRLKAENLQNGYQAVSMIHTLLGIEVGESPTNSDGDDDKESEDYSLEKLDDRTARELIDLITAAALKQSGDEGRGSEGRYEGPFLLRAVESMMPQIQKYSPARAAELQKVIEERRKILGPQVDEREQYRNVFEEGDTEAMLEVASKAAPELKMSLTQLAVAKIASEGDLDRARQLINERITDPEQRKQMLARIEAAALQQAIAKGKLDEARAFLSRLAPLERAALLIEIASKALEKKDRKSALEILSEAQGLFTSQPVNFVELIIHLQMAAAYSELEPSRSFEILEQAIDQINPLMNALAMLEGFDLIRSFKDGELIGSGESPVLICTLVSTIILSQIARDDFDRAAGAAEKFARADVRILAQLAVAQGVLGTRKERGFSLEKLVMQNRGY